jgi:hypothetical protein
MATPQETQQQINTAQANIDAAKKQNLLIQTTDKPTASELRNRTATFYTFPTCIKQRSLCSE